ncbi:MAG: CPBP family intramembrane metalloprotease [Flavobacteriales bacterium]|nr:CPBP family intramembrane metalloprotease [Flavobacteriales bacterium]
MDRTPILENYNASGQFLIFIGLMLISVAVGVMLSALVVVAMMGGDSIGTNVLSDLDDSTVLAALKVSQFFASLAVFILPVIIFTLLTSKDGLVSLSLNKSIDVRSGIFVFLVVIAVLPFVNFTQEINKMMILPEWLNGMEAWMKAQEKSTEIIVRAFLNSTSVFALLGNILVMAIIPAIGEELCFRGVMQKLFGKMFNNPHVAIWVTAAIFSAIHMQFYGFIPRMLLGAMLGYLYHWSGSLWLAILAHLINNGFAVVLSYLIGTGNISPEVENIGSSDGT